VQLANFLPVDRGAAASATTRAVRQELDVTDSLTYPDPLHVPARVLAGPLDIRVDGDVVTVTCSAFPGVTGTHPAAERLLLRAVDVQSGELVGVADFSLNPSDSRRDATKFAARLRVPNPTAVVFDVYDSMSGTHARVSESDRARAAVLRETQEAFTLIRESRAFAAVGDGSAAEQSRVLARHLVTDELSLPERSAATRPLLSELAHAIRV
jgi:hypothetical protein